MLDAELERIEQQVRLVREESAVSRSPEALSARLDAVSSTLSETSRWMDQHADLMTDLTSADLDDALPSVPRTPVDAASRAPRSPRTRRRGRPGRGRVRSRGSEMAEGARLPAWAEEMRQVFKAGATSQFVLHGNVFDLVPAPDAQGRHRLRRRSRSS